jgi:hypothetical protein
MDASLRSHGLGLSYDVTASDEEMRGVLELRGSGGTHDGTMVDGWYRQDGTHNGKPRYKHLRDPRVEILWGGGFPGAGTDVLAAGVHGLWWVHGPGYFFWHGCYYFNRQQTDKPPTDGWEVNVPLKAWDGSSAKAPAPTLTWAAVDGTTT